MGNSKGTLKYRKVQRTPQNGENAGKKLWYATAVSDREMDFESFVTHISEHGSPYSRGCVHGVLMDALDHLQELILDGKSVRLSDLGLFSIGMTSRGEESKDKVSAASVEGVHLIVRNTKTGATPSSERSARLRASTPREPMQAMVPETMAAVQATPPAAILPAERTTERLTRATPILATLIPAKPMVADPTLKATTSTSCCRNCRIRNNHPSLTTKKDSL